MIFSVAGERRRHVKDRYARFCVPLVALAAAALFSVSAHAAELRVLPGEGDAAEMRVLPRKSGPADWNLSLQELISHVHGRNERIHYQKLEWSISRQAVKNAKALFEPQFVTSYLHDRSHIPKTVEDFSSLGFIDAGNDSYWKRNDEYNAALEGILPTGAQLRLGSSLKRLQNSMMDNYAYDRQYQTFTGASIVQPLLKNAGIGITMANLRVAEADEHMALQGYRREMLQVVAEAASAYWNLCLAQDKLRVRRESVRIAEEILRDNRQRVRTGKMAETEILEAQAGLALRKSQEIAAIQEQRAAMNTIMTLLSLPGERMDGDIVATDRLVARDVQVDFYDSYRASMTNRPEYISTLRKIEREGVRVAYAENQRWPQLDLKASYGINGLGNASARESLNRARDGDYESWSVGLELRIPIMGGNKSKSELAAAKQREQQVLLELKATETALANAVDTSINNVRNALAQGEHYAEAVRLNERLLQVELARLNAGKSNSRLVLERDEELNRAREYYLESLVNVEQALVALEAVKGTLLKLYGIDVAEEL